MQKKTFSIIIPVLNEESCIALILNSLNNQSVKVFEVIIVDNDSKDKTTKIIKEQIPNLGFPLKIVLCKQRGISYARNFGAKFAEGKYLCFFDADGILERNWIKNAQNILRDNNKLLVLSGFIIYKNKNILRYLLYNSYSGIGQPIIFFLQKWFKTAYLFNGNNMLIEKVLFQELGGFPHIVGEDLALTQIILKSIKDKNKFLSSMKLKVFYSSRRFEQKGFFSTLFGWKKDFRSKKDSKHYDWYR